jgi:hypothetical protein
MRRWNKHYIGLTVCVILFIVTAYLLLKPGQVNQPPYLSFSADVDGIKAITELMKEKGQQLRTWEQPWKQLPKGAGQALLVVQPAMLSEVEMDTLGEWIGQGNDVLLFATSVPKWQAFEPVEVINGTAVDNKPGDASGKPVDNKMPDQHTVKVVDEAQAGAAAQQAIIASGLRLLPHDELRPIFEDELGIVGARQKIGAGTLTVVLAPDWLTNGLVLENGHFELVWPLLDKGWKALWLDEYHHGYQTKAGLFAVYPAWLLALGAQLALALILALWMRAKRIGPVHTPRAWTVRRGDETLLAVAGWYERRRLRSEALAHSAERLRQLLRERWGVSPSASPQEAASAARIHWDADLASRLERMLHLAKPVQGEAAALPAGGGESVSAREFTARAREYGELIAELEKE